MLLFLRRRLFDSKLFGQFSMLQYYFLRDASPSRNSWRKVMAAYGFHTFYFASFSIFVKYIVSLKYRVNPYMQNQFTARCVHLFVRIQSKHHKMHEAKPQFIYLQMQVLSLVALHVGNWYSVIRWFSICKAHMHMHTAAAPVPKTPTEAMSSQKKKIPVVHSLRQ